MDGRPEMLLKPSIAVPVFSSSSLSSLEEPLVCSE
jgi:hypothetical protein